MAGVGPKLSDGHCDYFIDGEERAPRSDAPAAAPSMGDYSVALLLMGRLTGFKRRHLQELLSQTAQEWEKVDEAEAFKAAGCTQIPYGEVQVS